MKLLMIDILLRYAPDACEAASKIADYLEITAQARVSREEGTLLADWEDYLTGSGVLLLLSKGSVPPRASRADWQPVLDHIASNSNPPVACVLVDGCSYPKLLERKDFCRLDASPLRIIQSWAMALHTRSQHACFQPARLPWFTPDQDALEDLFASLVDRPGVAAIDSPFLAQDFARRASVHFRDVLWVPCTDRSIAFIAGDLARQAGVSLSGHPEEDFARLTSIVAEHRVLLVFDDAPDDLPLLPPGGTASVLVVTRGEQECLEAEYAKDSAEDRLWRAFSASNRSYASLALAGRIAELDSRHAADACRTLCEDRVIDPLDDTRFRVNAVRLDRTMQIRHTEALHHAFSRWSTDPELCDSLLTDVEVAFQRTSAINWPLAKGLAMGVTGYLNAHRRFAEAGEITQSLLRAAEVHNDPDMLRTCAHELSWIEERPDFDFRLNASGGAEQLGFEF